MEQKNKFYLTISGVDYEIKPHYKQLKKRYKKENNQNYFRESLDGKITLFNNDYLLVKNASLENTILFKVYRGEELYISASFNKSDCKFDHFKMSVELNLTYDDKYSKVLDAYENTYDLIKLAPNQILVFYLLQLRLLNIVWFRFMCKKKKFFLIMPEAHTGKQT